MWSVLLIALGVGLPAEVSQQTKPPFVAREIRRHHHVDSDAHPCGDEGISTHACAVANLPVRQALAG